MRQVVVTSGWNLVVGSLALDVWQDLVNPVHGSNDPAPVAGAVASGPGQFRNYTADTRYLESDPLRHGLDTKQARDGQGWPGAGSQET